MMASVAGNLGCTVDSLVSSVIGTINPIINTTTDLIGNVNPVISKLLGGLGGIGVGKPCGCQVGNGGIGGVPC
ncbi:hypothetical protein Bhyg_12119, partial [Pseudolycoriella hygida]